MNDTLTLLLANHRLRIDGARECGLITHIPGFPVFVVPAGEAGAAEWHIAFGREVTLPEEREELYHFDFEGGCYSDHLYRTADAYYYEIGAAGHPQLLMCYRGGDTIEATHTEDVTNLRFALWVAFSMLASRSRIVMIHSSVVVHRDKAVLFLGESGTGKSTHTSLWLKHIADAHLLNDDGPILAIEEGVPVVYGSPWSGKTHCYHQRRYPLAAAVRLSQAPYNRIERLDVLRAFGALQPSCPPALAQDEAFADNMVEVISDVIAAVPVFHLECLPDEAAARMSREAIFPAEG